MTKILLLSDTHGFIDEQMLKYIRQVDEVWHAGDIGDSTVIETIENIKPLRAVYGNIDGQDIRDQFGYDQRFRVENKTIWMTHIGGYPNKYENKVKRILERNPPDIFVCGHSHILKVIQDKKYKLLYLNPGAAGKYGQHNVRTMIRFSIDGNSIKDMEVIELEKRP